MGLFSKKEPFDENAKREKLSQLSEKELLIEIVIELERVNIKCNDISRKIVIWRN